MKLKFFLAAASLVALAPAAVAQVVVSDVDLFYKVFDAAKGKPTAAILQRDYIDAGSDGLRDFVPYRIVSGENLEKRIAKFPDVYANARACMAGLPGVQQQAPQLIKRLKALYPAATSPRVTVVIGATNSGGTTSAETGIILGLEVNCEDRSKSGLPLDQRLKNMLSHELIHTQQRGFVGDTVLSASLNEGVAEFLSELTSGQILNVHLPVWTKGKEAALKARFKADVDNVDLTQWLYNGMGTPDQPGDLGYWMGYLIAKSFYEKASDKPAAIARLLEETDAKALLRDSGW